MSIGKSYLPYSFSCAILIYGSKFIYANSQCQDDTQLGRLMQDLYCTDPAKLNYKEFAPQMEFLKYSKEVEEKMTDILDFYIAQAAERKVQEAERKENISIATNLLHSGMSAEFIAQNTKLSLDEVRELAAKLSA